MTRYTGKTTAARSQLMSKIHSTGGKAEVIIRKQLYSRGIRYRKNYKRLPGSPDIAITKYKIAVFIDGEFWHGKDWESRKERLKRNRTYWIEKIEENIARDERVDQELRAQGWIPLHFWEKDVLKDVDLCLDEILSCLIDQYE